MMLNARRYARRSPIVDRQPEMAGPCARTGHLSTEMTEPRTRCDYYLRPLIALLCSLLDAVASLFALR